MPNESSSEKTEEPTQKKIRDAREKGQVSKSNDVTSAFILIAMLVGFLTLWDDGFKRMSEMLVVAARFYQEPFLDGVLNILRVAFGEWVIVSFPFVLIALLAGLAGNLIQVGAIFAPEAVKPDLQKLNPIQGLKKIFSVKNIIEFLKSCIKVIVIGYVAYVLIKSYIDPLIHIPYQGVYAIIDLLKIMLFDFFTTILVIYVIIAGFDYFFQKKQYIKELRMTKDEVKREYKEMEGSPEIKGKRRQLHQELLMDDTIQNTKKSSVLVTNPEHYAVAVFYEPQKTKLPVIMAKGSDHLAQLMIKTAQEENIPIMRNVFLARQLYHEAPLKQFIPHEFLKPVAELIATVQQLTGGGLSG